MDLQYFKNKCHNAISLRNGEVGQYIFLTKEEEEKIYYMLFKKEITRCISLTKDKTCFFDTKLNFGRFMGHHFFNTYCLGVNKNDYLQWLLGYKLSKI